MSIPTEVRTITRADLNHERAVRATRLAGTFATMVARRPITATLSTDTSIPAPAWSTGKTISFREDLVAGNLHTPEGVLSIRGLTCHELAHILYTPRSGSGISTWARESGLHSFYNMLEDQRIERMLSGRFGRGVVPWLTATVAQHLLGDPSALDRAFPLIHGRTYLPLEMRSAIRQAYADQTILADLASVIDEYVGMVYPRDTERGKALVQRFADLLRNGDDEGGEGEGEGEPGEGQPGGRPGSRTNRIPTHVCNGGGDKGYDPTVRPADAGEQDKAHKSADARKDEADDLTDDAGEATDDQPNANNGDGDESSDTPSDESSDSDSDGESGGQANDAGSGDSGQTLTDVLSEVIESVTRDMSSVIRDTIKAVTLEDDDLDSVGAGALGKARFDLHDVDPETRLASTAFARELNRIKTAFDPGWEQETRSGRLNIRRYVTADVTDLDRIFDRYTPGRDDVADIECVIVLDHSGSMQGEPVDLAYRSLWAMKNALDKAGASTTALLFGDRSTVLYTATERAGIQMRHGGLGGGTQPLDALRTANDILARSDRAIKMLFVITDGVWGYGSALSTEDTLIQNMRKSGVLTAMAFVAPGQVSTDLSTIPAHECESVSLVSNTGDLLPLGRDLVRHAVARGLAR